MVEQPYRHADEILRNGQGHALWIGDVQAAENIAWLKEHQVRTVMTAASGFNLSYDPSIRHLTYDLQDRKTENISAHFDIAAFHIDKNLRNGSVLVHCGAGVSRSTTLVIAYLIKYKGFTFHTALKLCKSKRPQVCPNLGFQLQLKTYQKSHATLSQTSNLIIARTRDKDQKLLPKLSRNEHFHSTVGKPFSKIGSGHEDGGSQSLKNGDQRKQEITYLKKMAEFRFGITNMQKWRIHGEPFKPIRRPHS